MSLPAKIIPVFHIHVQGFEHDHECMFMPTPKSPKEERQFITKSQGGHGYKMLVISLL